MSKEKQTEALLGQYFKPREPGEVDLVAATRQLLVNHGIGDGIAFFDNDPNILFSLDKNSNVQRFKLNTWLETQYLSTGMDISNQRQMIMDNGDPNIWLEIFEKYHIPAMRSMGLPRSYV